MPTISIERIAFYDTPEEAEERLGMPDADRAVWYVVEDPAWDGRAMHLMQPFSKGPTRQDSRTGGNLWGWDGDRDTPTLSPSYLCQTGHYVDPQADPTNYVSIRVHLFLRRGRIELCGDSTVSLA